MINLQMYISKLYHSLHTYRHQQAIMLAVFIKITRPLLYYYSTIVQEFVEILVRWSSNGNVLPKGYVKNGYSAY